MDANEQWKPQTQALGAFIRAQRTLADLSLREMATMTHVSNAYLSQVERGLHQPSLRVLQSIADALDLSAEVLLAQAGLVGAAAPRGADGASESSASDTETAIKNDPDLSPEERETLLQVYRSYRHRGSAR